MNVTDKQDSYHLLSSLSITVSFLLLAIANTLMMSDLLKRGK